MRFTKSEIVTMLRESGDEGRAGQADRDLPDDVDTERDRGTLDKLGLDPKELHQKLTGEGVPHLS